MVSATPSADGTTGTVATDSSVYYHSGYWNDLTAVQRYMNRNLGNLARLAEARATV